MVKHIQTIRRLWPTNYLSVFDHFVGLALEWLISILKVSLLSILKFNYYASVSRSRIFTINFEHTSMCSSLTK